MSNLQQIRKKEATPCSQATDPDAQVPKSEFHLGEENLQNPAPPNTTASAGEEKPFSNMNICDENVDVDERSLTHRSEVSDPYAASRKAVDSFITN